MTVDVRALERALERMAAVGVRVGARRITPDDLGSLHASERRAIDQAVPKRQHEFATGRVLLRRLIGSDAAIPIGASRAPVLPPGFVGSLSHDRDVAVAAVSCEPGLVSLGIDVEPDEALGEELAASILRPDERGWDAHLAFTLKEAAYKSWSSAGGRMLDHHEVRLSVRGDTFRAVVLPEGTSIRGTFTTVSGRHLALAAVRELGERSVAAQNKLCPPGYHCEIGVPSGGG